MLAQDTRPGYGPFGLPLATETGPTCGACKVRHISAAAVRACYEIAQEQREQQQADYRMELALVRHLEDRGYDDARAQDEHEARTGVIGFREAWHLASPETCPCDEH